MLSLIRLAYFHHLVDLFEDKVTIKKVDQYHILLMQYIPNVPTQLPIHQSTVGHVELVKVADETVGLVDGGGGKLGH